MVAGSPMIMGKSEIFLGKRSESVFISSMGLFGRVAEKGGVGV